eukprot:151699-Pleurochrysis_carterae.AAC.5
MASDVARRLIEGKTLREEGSEFAFPSRLDSRMQRAPGLEGGRATERRKTFKIVRFDSDSATSQGSCIEVFAARMPAPPPA